MNTDANQKASNTMEAFFTRSRANEGAVLELTLPDGTPTPHSLVIYGIDSDNYRQASAASQRRLMELAKSENVKELSRNFLEEETLTLVASLVKSWTFAEPCTLENVKKFLVEAPQIRNEIDKLATRRSLFFKAGSTSSSPSQVGSSG